MQLKTQILLWPGANCQRNRRPNSPSSFSTVIVSGSAFISVPQAHRTTRNHNNSFVRAQLLIMYLGSYYVYFYDEPALRARNSAEAPFQPHALITRPKTFHGAGGRAPDYSWWKSAEIVAPTYARYVCFSPRPGVNFVSNGTKLPVSSLDGDVCCGQRTLLADGTKWVGDVFDLLIFRAISLSYFGNAFEKEAEAFPKR